MQYRSINHNKCSAYYVKQVQISNPHPTPFLLTKTPPGMFFSTYITLFLVLAHPLLSTKTPHLYVFLSYIILCLVLTHPPPLIDKNTEPVCLFFELALFYFSCLPSRFLLTKTSPLYVCFAIF